MGALLGESRLNPRMVKWFAPVAVFALLAMCSLRGSSLGWALGCGACFAVGYVGRMLYHLLLPVVVTAMLALTQTFVWLLFAAGAWKLGTLSFPFNAVGIACLGTFLFWLEWSLLPLWGTAQNFASGSPLARPVIVALGAAGGLWCVLWLAALPAVIVTTTNSPSRLWAAAAFAVSLVLVLLGNKYAQRRRGQTLRVATFGWAGTEFDGLTAITSQLQKVVRQASERGAKLLVTPETAIYVHDRAHFRVVLASLAEKYDIALAVGYFDHDKNENCIDLVSRDGKIEERYVKTHLVPALEHYTKGRGEIALMEVEGVKIGGLVCQDDNFPDIARKYAWAGAGLLVVPTNDWKRVKDIHFANHLWRALEFRFALARAASDGISALTSANGRVEASSDHFQDGPKLLVADVYVGSGRPTLYARTGDWFPIVCGIAALACLLLAHG